MHDGDALDHAQRDVEVVLDQHEAHVRRQRGQQRHQLAAFGGREAGCRLVEQDQPRRAGQRHADLELALLAVREIGDALVGDVRQACAFEQVAGGHGRRMACARAQEAEAAVGDAAHREEQVVAHREVAKQQRRLVGAPQPFADALVRRQVGDVFAEEMDPPGGGREVAGDGVEQRGLAGAVGAEDRVLLAGGDRQRHVVDGAQRAEGARHAAEHQGIVGQQLPGRCVQAPAPTARAVGCRSEVIEAIVQCRGCLLAAVGHVARAQAHLLELRLRHARASA